MLMCTSCVISICYPCTRTQEVHCEVYTCDGRRATGLSIWGDMMWNVTWYITWHTICGMICDVVCGMASHDMKCDRICDMTWWDMTCYMPFSLCNIIFRCVIKVILHSAAKRNIILICDIREQSFNTSRWVGIFGRRLWKKMVWK